MAGDLDDLMAGDLDELMAGDLDDLMADGLRTPNTHAVMGPPSHMWCRFLPPPPLCVPP